MSLIDVHDERIAGDRRSPEESMAMLKTGMETDALVAIEGGE